MQDGTIGRRYARALSLSLGDDAKVSELRTIEGELTAVSEMLQQRKGNTDFRQSMLNPSFGADRRLAILEAVGEAHKFNASTQRLLRLLVEKERLPFLPDIARAFALEVDERSGQVRAQITSARMLDDAQTKTIVKALEERTGKTVVPELEVEPEIIGGVHARVGGLVFDNSVRSQLDRMKQALSR